MATIHPEIKRRFGRDPKIIFARDKWKCVVCGSKEDLTIDHIDGNGRNSKKPNNKMSNLRTLCRKCHGSIDGKRSNAKRKIYFNHWNKEYYLRNPNGKAIKIEKGGD